ncbi:MAG: EamA family transporter [Planctomycetota bacterium]
MILGIALGLMTALGHSLAYLATRWFTQDRGRPTTQLLVLAHVMMGVVSGLALPWLWPDGVGLDAVWLKPYAALVFFFVIAQSCLIGSLKYADASRVAPLISLKVAMLAGITVAMGATILPIQWAAVGLAVAAAFVLNGVGGRMPGRATGLVVLACVCYALADTMILEVIEAGRALSGDRSVMGGPLWCVGVVYAGTGVLAVGLLPWWGGRDVRGWEAWRDALPYTGAWLGAMVMLYATFASVGLVFGAILQSTRGLISIGLGVALAHAGWHHLEQKHGASVVGRRLAAAALMTAAVALYVIAGAGSG